MICLTSTSDIIRLTTSAAVALDVHASFVDNTLTTYAPGRSNFTISTATTTTVVAAPAASTQRGVKRLQACARGGANTVTVECYDGASGYRLISVPLSINETLEYEDASGWRVLTALGEQKGIGATGPTGPAANPTVSHLGWAPTATGQTSNLLTLLSAGHAPGLYLVGIAQVPRTAANCQGQETISWSNSGAASYSTGTTNLLAPNWSTGAIATTAGAGMRVQFPRLIYSDGVSAITAQITAQGFTGAPVIDVYASACRIGT